MRSLQIVLFIVGVAAFIAALAFIGNDTGDTLWRAGVAVLLLDVVCMMLWPAGTGRNETAGS